MFLEKETMEKIKDMLLPGCYSLESVDYPDFAHQLSNIYEFSINSEFYMATFSIEKK